jgi:superfamily II DNA or RNA helicase
MSQDAPSVPAARSSPSSSSLRAWQVRALEQLRDWRGGPFLISAAPGAGKTRPALELARRLLRERQVTRIALICPTAPLTRQWAVAAAKLGVHLVPDAESPRPPKDFDGVAVTYARVAMAGERWSRLVSPGTLVIADEAHHLGEDLAWGDGFATAFAAAPRWLMLSGTPFRSDATPIPGLRYDRDGVVEPDVSYSYAEAVQDGICRPVSFVTYDGTLSWRSGDDVIESTFDTVLTGREASRRYRTAISTELPDGLPRILNEAHIRLMGIRDAGHRDAGGLVVAADGTHARQIAKLLREATGRAPTVVLHTEARAAQKLADFTASKDAWLVAVNMVSEGVDIPRLRVGVYATAAKTPLIFRQIVGRFVRTFPGRPAEPSWLYLPADPVLRRHASEVETELRHALRRPADDDGLLDEPRERRETERGEVEAFVPVAADVVPQMTLFGPAPGAPGGPVAPAAPPPIAFPSAVTDAAGEPEEEAGMPAYQRRALLRDKRHRLVADLRRLDGRSHAEINSWLNRACGIGKVGDATIEQLDRSIELLLGELTARR